MANWFSKIAPLAGIAAAASKTTVKEQPGTSNVTSEVKRNTMIWVTFQREGIHRYPAAMDDPKLATGDWDDVSFLGVPHRHMFHFRVAIQVFHNDRDIEFIQFKRWLTRLYDHATLQLDYKSCEMIAEDLYQQIQSKYPGRTIEIEVSEDGENGCNIKWEV